MSDALEFLWEVLKGAVLFMACALLAVVLYLVVFGSPEQNDCERNLPRSEKCVSVWIPESQRAKP